ncbi:MAG: bifunctional UDP-sugar hydrolase/5'-nucleotidase [Anaerolineae bacterium]
MPNPLQLTILHTNDLHGRIERLPRIATIIREQRAQAEAEGRHVLVVDAGDSEDETLLESAATRGVALMRLLNAVGYDIAALGNAIVIRYGPAALADEAEAATFPILAANFRWPDGGLVEGATDRLTLDIDGFRLGLTGATADFKDPHFGDVYRVFGLAVQDQFEATAEQVACLRAEGVDAVGVISHIGYGERPYRGDLTLVERTRGLAFIIGGHSHTLLETPHVVHGTPIVQAGDYGRFVGRLDLTLDPATGQPSEYRGVVFPVTDDIPPAPDVAAAIEAVRADTAAILDEPMGSLAQPLDLADDRECGVGDWLADRLRAFMAAEIGLVSTGLLRRALPEGVITRRMRFETCATGANPCRTELTGADILALLEHTLNPEYYRQRPPSFRGRARGILQVSGLTVDVDASAETGRRVRHVLVGSEPLDPERRYLVAATDAELSNFGFAQVIHLDDAALEIDASIIAGDLLDADLRAHSPVRVRVGGRIRIS